MQTEKLVFIIISVLTVVIFGGIFASSFKNDKVANTSGTDVVGSDPHTIGSTNPKLTIVEFSDFECPFCAQASPVLDGLVNKYKDLALVYRHFPLSIHAGSIPSARASEAAAMQGKFWEYHDELFANQPNFTVSDLEKYAADIGLDVEKFKADFASPEVANKVNEDAKLASTLQLTGTPSFFVVYDGKTEKLNINSFSDVESKIIEILGSVDTATTDNTSQDANSAPISAAIADLVNNQMRP